MRIRSLSPAYRIATFMIAVVTGVTLCVSAVTVVSAASRTKSYQACANKHHALALLNKGHCPRHFRKVSFGARGPAGPSDVYVATSDVTPTPDLRRSSVSNGSPTPLPLSLPAGSYLLNWQVEISGFKHNTGTPTGLAYNLTLECAPSLTSGGVVTYGLPDSQTSTLTSDDYSAASNITSFDFDSTLSNVWAVTIPSRGAQLSVQCEQPSLLDESGAPFAVDSVSALAHLAATKVATLHGRDPTLQ